MEIPYRPRKEDKRSDVLSDDMLLILCGIVLALVIAWLNSF